MASKKVPISISPEWLTEINTLAALMGMDRTVYGYIPKTLRFSITLAIATIQNEGKGIPDLKTTDLETYFSCIKKNRAAAKLKETATIAAAEAEKVYPSTR